MKFLSNLMIAAAIVLVVAGCTNPSGGSDSETVPIGSSVKLTAADAANSDFFGYSVSVSGDTAIVGAYGEDDNGSYSGSAYIFTHSGGSWSQTAKLTADDGADNDYFGYSVSISDDTAVVGAYGGGDNGGASGSAYIFTFSGGNWSQTAKLTADDAAEGDNFGYSVSISDDIAVVGACGDSDDGTSSGSAYIFALSGGSWSQAAKLTADDGAERDFFGISVAAGDDLAVVGAYYDDDGGAASGSAYLYELNGGSWTQTDKLIADDAASNDIFGFSVSASEDRILIGAYQEDDGGSDSGAAYLFEND